MQVKLKDIFLFQDLCDDTISKIEEFTTRIKLLKDNILFYEGDESRYLYLLSTGIIKLCKTASNDVFKLCSPQ